jgi:phenylacetate-CoA ligase
MSDDNLQYYVDKLEHFRPRVLEGYPSTLYILARYLNDKRLTLPLTAALTSSETLFPYQQEAIEKAFNCKIFDFYGHAERAIFASECSYHLGKHLNLEYGITEFLDEKGIPVSAGATGRMTGTSLHNLGMPMIRYATDDMSSIKEHACECGRTLPLMEAVSTKHEDIVITPDGRWISPSVLTHPFKPLKNILESQIIQEDPNRIVVKIVKRPSYNHQDSSLLIEGLKDRLGHTVDIKIDFVTHIPREISGKFRWVISKVPRP